MNNVNDSGLGLSPRTSFGGETRSHGVKRSSEDDLYKLVTTFLLDICTYCKTTIELYRYVIYQYLVP